MANIYTFMHVDTRAIFCHNVDTKQLNMKQSTDTRENIKTPKCQTRPGSEQSMDTGEWIEHSTTEEFKKKQYIFIYHKKKIGIYPSCHPMRVLAGRERYFKMK